MRPHQWAKNLLVVLAPAGAGMLFDVNVLSRLLLLWVCFSLVASGVYLYNDVRDAELDRLDPRKASRPLASGQLTSKHASRIAGVLVVSGLLLGSYLDPGAGLVIGVYVVNTLLYSWRLKHVPILEVLLVASGFVARAAAGALLVDAPLSGWFLPLVVVVAVFVVLVKRSGELHEGRSRRPVLAVYRARALASARSVAAVLALALYGGWVLAAPVLVPAAVSFLVLAAVLYRVNASVASGGASAPDELVFRDPVLVVLALTWFGCFLAAVG
jgi:decaprenyl-phosphate phosphoribosyltransferase